MKTIEQKAEEICDRLTCHEVVDDEREELENHWANDPRWKGIVRPYSAEDVLKLRGNLTIEYTFAKIGAKRLWYLINHDDYVPALGALTGNQAVQQVRAGLPRSIRRPDQPFPEPVRSLNVSDHGLGHVFPAHPVGPEHGPSVRSFVTAPAGGAESGRLHGCIGQ